MIARLLLLSIALSLAAGLVFFHSNDDYSLQQFQNQLTSLLPGRIQQARAGQAVGGAASVQVATLAAQAYLDAEQVLNSERCVSGGDLPAPGVCRTSLPVADPVVVGEDNSVVENLDINSPEHDVCGILILNRENVTVRNVNINHAGAGICVFSSRNIKIESARIISTIAVAGPHCRPGLTVDECKMTHRRKYPEKLFPVNSHNNIWVRKSANVVIDTVYLEKGESGVFTNKTSGLTINNFYCRDIRGPYWRGQCVQVANSDGAKISRFYTQQFLQTSSGHDNISAFESSNVEVSDGLIDGNWSRNGVGVIADTNAHNMRVRDVDIIHNGTAGVNVWSGPTKKDNGKVGKNFTVDNVRVKSGHCDVTWFNLPDYGPSSGGMAFAMHPAASGAKFTNSVYADHCRESAVFGRGNPVIKDIKEQDFKIKPPPVDITFPWM